MTTKMFAVIVGAASQHARHWTSPCGTSRRHNAENSRSIRLIWAVAAAIMLTEPTAAAAQVITEFPIPTPNTQPLGITRGPDGALWFTEIAQIGRITTAGVVTEYPTPTAE